MDNKVLIEVSARHIHLCQRDLEILFGKEHQLKRLTQLTQPCDFAAEEVLDIKVDQSEIKSVRTVGPLREKTQVEVSITDAIKLGFNPPIRISGDLKGSAGIILVGPEGEVKLEEGAIIAHRHLHCAIEEAKKLKLRNGQVISVMVGNDREVVFNNIIVRVGDSYKLCLHLDTDEANAAGINKKAEGLIIKK